MTRETPLADRAIQIADILGDAGYPGACADMMKISAALRSPAISAVPDLIEALKAMVDRWEPGCIGRDRVMWENARAALEKAGAS